MITQVSTNQSANSFDIYASLLGIANNPVDFIILCCFLFSIFASFYFFHWLRINRIENVCSNNY
ncbi:conserved protein, unknown function [Hepatocystis sp. ex Piliocolobus tephrosceles]|nr:conserved protein, unknown function [Hepatocystis sp. ex Piliocolobus tephrosceles]VWU51531.1 conserved protein, unknown function [Hepatocystis sp. ex Piliocolobus tephrosceles]